MRYRKNRISDYVANLFAVCFLVILICIAYNKLFCMRSNFFIPQKNIAAFQLPFKSFMQLQNLARKYNIPFEELLSVYSLENNFFPDKSIIESESEIEKNLIINYNEVKKKYSRILVSQFTSMFKNILADLKCFPIPNNISVNNDIPYIFGDSWERKVNDKIPQGCDIFDRENISGHIPIISTADGEIKNICWNDSLGYNIEIKAPSGNDYLYCHLERFEPGLEKNSKIKAGQILGYMGNTKKEDIHKSVHLHFCIKPKVNFVDRDFFIDPYLFLRLLEAKKISAISN